jgi:hypothetical protein
MHVARSRVTLHGCATRCESPRDAPFVLRRDAKGGNNRGGCHETMADLRRIVARAADGRGLREQPGRGRAGERAEHESNATRRERPRRGCQWKRRVRPGRSQPSARPLAAVHRGGACRGEFAAIEPTLDSSPRRRRRDPVARALPLRPGVPEHPDEEREPTRVSFFRGVVRPALGAIAWWLEDPPFRRRWGPTAAQSCEGYPSLGPVALRGLMCATTTRPWKPSATSSTVCSSSRP